MKIGELAQQTGIPTETIRYYEKQKLLPEPIRTHNNYRIYNQEHVDRLVFIRNCRAFDMAHEEIHQLLKQLDAPNSSCDTTNIIIQEHLNHIDVRISELIALKNKLSQLQETCTESHPTHDCTILKGLSKMNIQPKKNSHL